MNVLYGSMKEKWENRVPEPIERGIVRHSAVMVPLIEKNGHLEVLFEVRAASLKRQPGEVCFPGGGCEPDETRMETAVRETSEELLIDQSQIEVLAPLDYMENNAGLIVWPYLGVLKDYQGTYSKDEVDRVFSVPLAWLLEQEEKRYQCTVHTVPDEDFPFNLVPGGRDYHWRKGKYDVFFYQYEGEIIWGMTAKILRAFLNLYKKDFNLE